MNRNHIPQAAVTLLFLTLAFPALAQELVKDVKNLPTTFDETLGMQVARLDENLKQLNAWVGKLPPGRESVARRHLYEEVIYVIEGRGHTLLWKDPAKEPVRLDWAVGDLFSPGLNFKHQHFNHSSSEEAVLFHVSTRPLAELMYGPEIMDRVDYIYASIWDEYFPLKEPRFTGLETQAYAEMKAGFLVKDTLGMDLPLNRPGHNGIAFLPFPGRGIAGNRLFEIQVFHYEPPSESPYNRHEWEVVYYVMEGSGGAIFHMEDEEPKAIHFQEGDFFFEPARKWHWHGPVDGSAYRIIQIKASAYFRNTLGVEPVYLDKPSNFPEFYEKVQGRQK